MSGYEDASRMHFDPYSVALSGATPPGFGEREAIHLDWPGAGDLTLVPAGPAARCDLAWSAPRETPPAPWLTHELHYRRVETVATTLATTGSRPSASPAAARNARGSVKNSRPIIAEG